MGINTLNNITAPKVIETSDINQYFTSTTGDFLPRNATSGAVQTEQHSLGSSAYQWQNLYAKYLIIDGVLFDPTASGAGIDSSNAIVSGATRTDSGQPDFLRASGSGASMTILAATTPLNITANSVSVSITSDISVTSLTTAPAANNTCLVNDLSLTGQSSSKYTGEDKGKPIVIDTVGTEISNRVGEYICLKGATEYMLAYVDDATTLRHVYRGFFFDSSGNPIVREVLTNNDTLTIMSLGWVFVESNGTTVDISYTSPVYSGVEPQSPVIDDYWFDLVNRVWKRYDGSSYQTVNRMLIGITVIDGTDCVATRSFDFTKPFYDIIEMESEIKSVTEAQTKSGRNVISVYGNTNKYNAAPLVWDITANLESGLTEASSTLYYLYVTEHGIPKISTERPYNRLSDLRGFYHPYHSWRHVGSAYNDGSSDFNYSINRANPNDVWEKVTTLEVSTSTPSIDFVDIFEDGYIYNISLSRIIPVTDAVDLYMRLGTSGTAFISSASYKHSGFIREIGGGEFNLGLSGDNQVNFNGAVNIGRLSREGVSGNISYDNPAEFNGYSQYNANLTITDPSSNPAIAVMAGLLNSSSPVVGIQFLFSSGDIASGKISITRKAL